MTSAIQNRRKPVLHAIVLLVIGVLSATLLTSVFTSDQTYEKFYSRLNEKRNNVIALTVAATGASTAISFVPDDAGTPIANQLMEIAKSFAFVLAAIVLEKYLLTVFGFVFFAIIIPMCCLLVAASHFMKPDDTKVQAFQQSALKLFALGLVLFLATPASVLLSSKIDSTYQASIDATVAQESELTNVAKQAETKDEDAAKEEANRKEAENPLQFIQQVGEDVASNVGSAVSSAGNLVTGALDTASTMVGNLIELFGVMIATTILIPLLSPLVMYLAFKALLGQSASAAPQKIEILPAQSTESTAGRPALESKQEEAHKGDEPKQ